MLAQKADPATPDPDPLNRDLDRSARAITNTLTRLWARVDRVAAEKISGPKFRRGTTLWDPPTSTPPDFGSLFDVDRLVSEAAEEITPILAGIVEEAATPRSHASKDDLPFDLSQILTRLTSHIRNGVDFCIAKLRASHPTLTILRSSLARAIKTNQVAAETVGQAMARGTYGLAAERIMATKIRSRSGQPRRLNKTWITAHDDRVRPAHAIADHQTVPLGDSFQVGGFPMRFPHDPSAPIHLTARCRCVLGFSLGTGRIRLLPEILDDLEDGEKAHSVALALVADLTSLSLKHLPGLHDQSSHGRRHIPAIPDLFADFSATPTLPAPHLPSPAPHLHTPVLTTSQARTSGLLGPFYVGLGRHSAHRARTHGLPARLLPTTPLHSTPTEAHLYGPKVVEVYADPVSLTHTSMLIGPPVLIATDPSTLAVISDPDADKADPDWDPHLHPRDDHGRFARVPGSHLASTISKLAHLWTAEDAFTQNRSQIAQKLGTVRVPGGALRKGDVVRSLDPGGQGVLKVTAVDPPDAPNPRIHVRHTDGDLPKAPFGVPMDGSSWSIPPDPADLSFTLDKTDRTGYIKFRNLAGVGVIERAPAIYPGQPDTYNLHHNVPGQGVRTDPLPATGPTRRPLPPTAPKPWSVVEGAEKNRAAISEQVRQAAAYKETSHFIPAMEVKPGDYVMGTPAGLSGTVVGVRPTDDGIILDFGGRSTGLLRSDSVSVRPPGAGPIKKAKDIQVGDVLTSPIEGSAPVTAINPGPAGYIHITTSSGTLSYKPDDDVFLAPVPPPLTFAPDPTAPNRVKVTAPLPPDEKPTFTVAVSALKPGDRMIYLGDEVTITDVTPNPAPAANEVLVAWEHTTSAGLRVPESQWWDPEAEVQVVDPTALNPTEPVPTPASQLRPGDRLDLGEVLGGVQTIDKILPIHGNLHIYFDTGRAIYAKPDATKDVLRPTSSRRRAGSLKAGDQIRKPDGSVAEIQHIGGKLTAPTFVLDDGTEFSVSSLDEEVEVPVTSPAKTVGYVYPDDFDPQRFVFRPVVPATSWSSTSEVPLPVHGPSRDELEGIKPGTLPPITPPGGGLTTNQPTTKFPQDLLPGEVLHGGYTVRSIERVGEMGVHINVTTESGGETYIFARTDEPLKLEVGLPRKVPAIDLTPGDVIVDPDSESDHYTVTAVDSTSTPGQVAVHISTPDDSDTIYSAPDVTYTVLPPAPTTSKSVEDLVIGDRLAADSVPNLDAVDSVGRTVTVTDFGEPLSMPPGVRSVHLRWDDTGQNFSLPLASKDSVRLAPPSPQPTSKPARDLQPGDQFHISTLSGSGIGQVVTNEPDPADPDGLDRLIVYTDPGGEPTVTYTARFGRNEAIDVEPPSPTSKPAASLLPGDQITIEDDQFTVTRTLTPEGDEWADAVHVFARPHGEIHAMFNINTDGEADFIWPADADIPLTQPEVAAATVASKYDIDAIFEPNNDPESPISDLAGQSKARIANRIAVTLSDYDDDLLSPAQLDAVRNPRSRRLAVTAKGKPFTDSDQIKGGLFDYDLYAYQRHVPAADLKPGDEIITSSYRGLEKHKVVAVEQPTHPSVQMVEVTFDPAGWDEARDGINKASYDLTEPILLAATPDTAQAYLPRDIPLADLKPGMLAYGGDDDVTGRPFPKILAVTPQPPIPATPAESATPAALIRVENPHTDSGYEEFTVYSDYRVAEPVDLRGSTTTTEEVRQPTVASKLKVGDKLHWSTNVTEDDGTITRIEKVGDGQLAVHMRNSTNPSGEDRLVFLPADPVSILTTRTVTESNTDAVVRSRLQRASGGYGNFNDVRFLDPSSDEARAVLREQAVSDLIHEWASSSNDRNPRTLALQETAREMFGLTGTFAWNTIGAISPDERRELVAKVHKEMEDHHDMYEAFLKAQYDESQRRLKAANIRRLRLFRGWNWYDATPRPDWAKDADGSPRNVPMRPLNSWAYTRYEAGKFGGGGVITVADVPAERILSWPQTGFGSLTEDEFVILGGDFPVEVRDGGG